MSCYIFTEVKLQLHLSTNILKCCQWLQITGYHQTLLITSPVGVVAKYCDEHVCVCESVSRSISIRIHMRDLYKMFWA